MDEEFTISTPEQVAFHYETAGIGSRLVAALLDHLIIGVVLVLIYCAASGLLFTALVSDVSGENGQASQAGVYLIIGILVLVTFLILWGYFALFEIVWKGRTPGKRAGKLRVIKRSGQPIGAGEAIIRNLVRLVDFLPSFYGVGLIVMFVDRDARRLGDLAAGTVVVREGEQVRLGDVRVAASPPAMGVGGDYAAAAATSGYGVPMGATVPTPVAPRFDPLPGISLRGLTSQDYLIMSELLERVRRGELQWGHTQELAARVAYGVAGKLGHDFREWQGRGWDPLVFVESVLVAREARGE